MSTLEEVLNNATVTTSGSFIYRPGAAAEVTAVINITATPTGTSPTLTVTLTEMEPGQEIVETGESVFATYTSIASNYLTLSTVNTTLVKISWVVNGTSTPTFTGVNITTFSKPVPSFQPLNLQSGFFPDPSVTSLQIVTPALADSSGQIIGRNTVMTDEGSFREDFIGDSLSGSLTGTCVFTSGSTTVRGIGTLFTEEVLLRNYIRLSSDAVSAFAEVDYVSEDLELFLVYPYTGTGGTGVTVKSNWQLEQDSATTVSVAASTLSLTLPVTSGKTISLVRAADYLPFVFTMNSMVSNRRANQECHFGLMDSDIDPQHQAIFVLDGTDETKVTCRSGFASDSIEETIATLPGTTLSSENILWNIEISPNSVAYFANGSLLATHRLHIPGPYSVMDLIIQITNTGITDGSTTLGIDSVFIQNVDQVQTGNIFRAEPTSVQGVAGGVPIIIQFGTGTGPSLPLTINLNYNQTAGAIVANSYKRAITYKIPSGYTAYLIKTMSFQNETASSRLVTETALGLLSIITNVYTAESSYVAPQFTSVVESEVVTALSAGAGNCVITVTYTNEVGTAGRTGTITIPKGSVIGTRNVMVLATGDIGVRSIQNLVTAPTLVAGTIKILGLVQLVVHQDQSTTSQTETIYAPGAITMPTGTILGVEFSGGAVSKLRVLDNLLQLSLST